MQSLTAQMPPVPDAVDDDLTDDGTADDDLTDDDAVDDDLTDDAGPATAPTLGQRLVAVATRTQRRVTDVALRTRYVWAGFAAVHLWIAYSGVFWIPNRVFRDLHLYNLWVTRGLDHGFWPVLDGSWVYPAGALVPLVAVGWVARQLHELTGMSPDRAFYAVWAVMVTALNFVAVRRLLRHPGGRVATWWWVGFLAFLGPVAVGRLDALVAPLVILGLLAVAKRPRLAAALLTAGAWIKVAPGALLLPVVAALRGRWHAAVVSALAVCAAVVGTVALLGGWAHVGSFLTEQGDRGLQVESVGASPWLVWGLYHGPVRRSFNPQIITYEVTGPGVVTAWHVLDMVFYVTMAAVAALLAWRAWGPRRLPVPELLARGSLLVLLTMIVTNKVLSPQYLAWLAAPVAVALAWRLPKWRDRTYGSRSWVATAWGLLVIGAATQIIFPWAYGSMLAGMPWATWILVWRNVALVALWLVTAWAVIRPSVVQTSSGPDAARHGRTRGRAWPRPRTGASGRRADGSADEQDAQRGSLVGGQAQAVAQVAVEPAEGVVDAGQRGV